MSWSHSVPKHQLSVKRKKPDLPAAAADPPGLWVGCPPQTPGSVPVKKTSCWNGTGGRRESEGVGRRTFSRLPAEFDTHFPWLPVRARQRGTRSLTTRIKGGTVVTHWLVGGALSGMATSSSSYSGPSSESASSTVPSAPANGVGGSGGKPGSAAPVVARGAGPAPSSSSPRTEHKAGPPGEPPPTRKGPCGSGARPRHKAGQCPSSPAAAAAPTVPAAAPEPPSSPVASAAIILSLAGRLTPGRWRQRGACPYPHPAPPSPPSPGRQRSRDVDETSRRKRVGNSAGLGGGWGRFAGPRAAPSAGGRPGEVPPPCLGSSALARHLCACAGGAALAGPCGPACAVERGCADRGNKGLVLRPRLCERAGLG